MLRLAQTSSRPKSLWTPRSQSRWGHNSMGILHWCPFGAAILSSSCCESGQPWSSTILCPQSGSATRSLQFETGMHLCSWSCIRSERHELDSRHWRSQRSQSHFLPSLCWWEQLSYRGIARAQWRSSCFSLIWGFLFWIVQWHLGPFYRLILNLGFLTVSFSCWRA